VHYFTLNGDMDQASGESWAVGGEDYEPANGLLVFEPGQFEIQVGIPIKGDAYPEPDEVFSLYLSHPINATLANRKGTCTILNDDGSTLSIIEAADAAGPEGDSGTATHILPVVLTHLSDQTVTAKYDTVDGSAEENTDYVPISGGLIVFAPRQSIAYIPLLVKGNSEPGYDKNFMVKLHSPTNAQISRDTGIFTIEDDDPPSITIAQTAEISEPRRGTSYVPVMVSLSSVSSHVVTVYWMTVDGTATAGHDFYPAGGRLDFYPWMPNDTIRNINVTIRSDNYKEPTEHFFVKLVSSVNGTIENQQATCKVNILPTISFFKTSGE
jgi:hypothetical protein